ncbi:hypothetical protein RYX36_032810 [Vicia faba]
MKSDKNPKKDAFEKNTRVHKNCDYPNPTIKKSFSSLSTVAKYSLIHLIKTPPSASPFTIINFVQLSSPFSLNLLRFNYNTSQSSLPFRSSIIISDSVHHLFNTSVADSSSLPLHRVSVNRRFNLIVHPRLCSTTILTYTIQFSSVLTSDFDVLITGFTSTNSRKNKHYT